jgi:UDPglucose--hexose-1-phosphate uridylyltransferase
MSEMRWNPMLGEWVVTATHRQDRTFLPPPDHCPLCPTQPGGFESEIPFPDYDVAVFENRFQTFFPSPPPPSVHGSELCPVQPSEGVCEVVVYTPQHDATLAQLPLSQYDKLVQVWADRYVELGSLPYVQYVLIFENKGEEIGVTLHHPHGQIYGFPFIPPVIKRELHEARAHMDHTGRCLFCDILAEEGTDGRRIVAENDGFAAFVPFFARWPYEVHIFARRHIGAMPEFSDGERADFARILKTVLMRYDALFGFSLPYMMLMHQQPTDGKDYPEYHFHVEFYPPHRAADKLKYRASCESGGGTFINDTLPEETAARLRDAVSTQRS